MLRLASTAAHHSWDTSSAESQFHVFGAHPTRMMQLTSPLNNQVGFVSTTFVCTSCCQSPHRWGMCHLRGTMLQCGC